MTEKDQNSANNQDLIKEIEAFLKTNRETQQLANVGKGTPVSLRAFLFSLNVLQRSDNEKLRENAKRVEGMLEKGEIGIVIQNKLSSNEEETPIVDFSLAFFGEEKRPIFTISPCFQPEESKILDFAKKFIEQTVSAMDRMFQAIEIFESEVDLSEKFGREQKET